MEFALKMEEVEARWAAREIDQSQAGRTSLRPAWTQAFPFAQRAPRAEEAMRKPLVAAGFHGFHPGGNVMAADGLTAISSSFGPKETMDRLEAEVRARGMTVFARIDHAAGAVAVGMPLRPTELLIFGAARAGTPLMQVDQAVGIDLPLKALVYEDEAGRVWLVTNDPRWIASRHGLSGSVAPTVDAMAAALEGLARRAAGSP